MRKRHSADSDSTNVPETDCPAIDAHVSETPEEGSDDAASSESFTSRTAKPGRVLVFVALPIIAMLVAGGAAFLKWEADTAKASRAAAVDSVQAATDTTIKMLSYSPDTVEHDLDAVRVRMTSTFRDDYTKLTHDVVIPGAKEKKISAVAKVPGASSVSASADHAVVLVFVNQSVQVGTDPPANTLSSVRVTLDKRDGQWLVSAFDPI